MLEKHCAGLETKCLNKYRRELQILSYRYEHELYFAVNLNHCLYENTL